MAPEPVLPSSFESLRKRLLSKRVLVVFLILILLASGVSASLYFSGILHRIGLFPSAAPRIELKTEYKNHFKAEAQYVNPFEEFKNPFDNL